MKLFTQRLKELGVGILFIVLGSLFVVTPFAIIWYLGDRVSPAIPAIFFGLVFLGIIVFYVYNFIHWLIIEPIQVARKKKKQAGKF